MNTEVNYKNNPLHGVSLKDVVTKLVGHYGFEILYAYLNINCFNKNPSITSSVKFLKRTDWAREKVEAFYLYEFKNLPRASDEQFLLSPRDRIIPDDQKPAEPAKLSLDDAQQLREKREEKAAEFDQYGVNRPRPYKRSDSHQTQSSDIPVQGDVDPWARWKKTPED